MTTDLTGLIPDINLAFLPASSGVAGFGVTVVPLPYDPSGGPTSDPFGAGAGVFEVLVTDDASIDALTLTLEDGGGPLSDSAVKLALKAYRDQTPQPSSLLLIAVGSAGGGSETVQQALTRATAAGNEFYDVALLGNASDAEILSANAYVVDRNFGSVFFIDDDASLLTASPTILQSGGAFETIASGLAGYRSMLCFHDDPALSATDTSTALGLAAAARLSAYDLDATSPGAKGAIGGITAYDTGLTPAQIELALANNVNVYGNYDGDPYLMDGITLGGIQHRTVRIADWYAANLRAEIITVVKRTDALGRPLTLTTGRSALRGIFGKLNERAVGLDKLVPGQTTVTFEPTTADDIANGRIRVTVVLAATTGLLRLPINIFVTESA